MSTLRADVTLSTGRVVTHRHKSNGAQEAIVKDDELSPITVAEWQELCDVYKTRSVVAPDSIAARNAAELGKVAGERWAARRLKLKARTGRIAVAQVAGVSHMTAWDDGKVTGATSAAPYCQAFITAAFAALDPAGLVTL